jgi:hypothetical protein
MTTVKLMGCLLSKPPARDSVSTSSSIAATVWLMTAYSASMMMRPLLLPEGGAVSLPEVLFSCKQKGVESEHDTKDHVKYMISWPNAQTKLVC